MDAIAKGGAALLFCAAVALVCWGIVADSTAPEEPAAEPEPTYELVLDCSNAKQMHDHGLPTKADCMEWHVHGQWGYFEDGVLRAYDELPGSAKVWDALYGIEDNPGFDKHA